MSSLQLSTAASTVTGVYGGDLPTHQHSGLQSDDGDGGDGEEEEEGDDSDDSDVAHDGDGDDEGDDGKDGAGDHDQITMVK